MLNLKTGRFFIGEGSILYPAMRKKEFFQTNFFRKLLIEEEREMRELEEFHIRNHNLEEFNIDLDIKFDVENDFIETLVIRSNDMESLFKTVGIEQDSREIYNWGKVEGNNEEIKITFDNRKFIR